MTLLECHAKGLTISETAKAMGITRKGAQNRANRAGLKFLHEINDRPREDDLLVLRLLDLRFGENMTVEAAGKAVGISKGAAVGHIHRIRQEDAPCACQKPENRNGGMPRGWWDDGKKI